jgi:TolB-like protein
MNPERVMNPERAMNPKPVLNSTRLVLDRKRSGNPLRLTALCIVSTLLGGCAFLNNECVNYLGKHTCGMMQSGEAEQPPVLPEYSDEGLRTRYSHKLLGDYVEQMTMQMVGSNPPVLMSPIAVASFVQFDSTLTRSDILGNQMAESFIHELQQYGMPVVDYKVTGAIRITPRGDFAFSRDVRELATDQAIGYILTGTIIRAKGGVIVNARIVGLTSKVVVASTKTFIPGFVLKSLYADTAKAKAEG